MLYLFIIILVYSLYKGAVAKNEYNYAEMFIYYILAGASFAIIFII